MNKFAMKMKTTESFKNWNLNFVGLPNSIFQAGKSSPGMLKEIGNRLFHLNTLIVRIYNMYLIPCVTHKQGYLFLEQFNMHSNKKNPVCQFCCLEDLFIYF
jgi:hypothetical protein